MKEGIQSNEPVLNTQLGRNIGWITWSGAVNIANSVAVWIFMARMRDVDEVGRFAIVMGIYALFNTIVSLGLMNYLINEISRRRVTGTQDTGILHKFISSAAVFLLISGVFFAIAMSVCGFVLSENWEVRISTLLLSPALIPTGLITLLEASAISFGRARLVAKATTVENVLRTLIPLGLIFAGSGMLAICASFAVVRFMALSVYLTAARNHLPRFEFSRFELRSILLIVPTFAGTIVFASINWQASLLLLGYLSSESETAKYGAASRFLVPASILLASYASVIQPSVARYAGEMREKLGAYLAKAASIPLILATLAAVASPLLSRPILTFMFGTSYETAGLTLDILAVGMIPFCVVIVSASGLVATGSQRIDLLANVLGAIVCVGTGAMFIPRYGAVGAAAAQLCSFITMAVIDVVFLSRICGEYDPRVAIARKPRILMVGMHLTKTRGGITTLAADILNSDLKAHYDLKYIASQAEELGNIGKALLAASATLQFIAQCVLNRPQLVYIHIGSNASLYRESAFAILGRLFRLPVISHFHAGDVDLYMARQTRFGRWFIRSAIGISSRVIAVSKESARQLAELNGELRISILPNAINTSTFLALRRPEEISSEPVRLLFVGAVGKLKGEKDLLRALQLVKKAGVEVRASLLGYRAESAAEYCRELGITDLIEHLGPVAMDRRLDFYRRADIFVLPTYAEAMPIAVIEAMAAGLPVVATKVGGIPEIMDDEVEGSFVGCGDVKELAERILLLSRDPKKRIEMGKNAQARVRDQMSFDKYIEGLRTVIDETVPGTSSKVPHSLVAKRSIKSIASLAKTSLGYPRVPPGSVNIFAYHRVVADIEKAERDAIYGIVISTATFRKHCELLRQHYHVVSLETAMKHTGEHNKHDLPTAVITFDDGYVDFYEEAFPVLRDMGLPATVFLPTDYIGQEKPLAHDRIYWLLKLALDRSVPMGAALRVAGVADAVAAEFSGHGDLLTLTDKLVYLPNELREKAITEMERELGDGFDEYPNEYQLMTWEMVREMSRSGIDFGGHTANHVILPLENGSVADTEIHRCKEVLDSRLGKPVVSFAYPNGEYNEAIRQVTANAGFTVAVTTRTRINKAGDDLLTLGRTSLCEESTRGIAGRYSQRVAELRLGI